MYMRKFRFPSIVFASIVLAANVVWAAGFRLSETKEQLKLKYDVSVQDHGTGRVTVNVTIVDQGRLTPLKSAALAIPSKDRTDRYDVTPLALKTVDGILSVSVELKKETAERAEIYLETATLDGKKLCQIWYYHAIPISAAGLVAVPVSGGGLAAEPAPAGGGTTIRAVGGAVAALGWAANASAAGSDSQPEDKGHWEWLAEIVKQTETIKIGMSRGDVEEILVEDVGRRFNPKATRYQHPRCPYVKLDLEFELVTSGDRKGDTIASAASCCST